MSQQTGAIMSDSECAEALKVREEMRLAKSPGFTEYPSYIFWLDAADIAARAVSEMKSLLVAMTAERDAARDELAMRMRQLQEFRTKYLDAEKSIQRARQVRVTTPEGETVKGWLLAALAGQPGDRTVREIQTVAGQPAAEAKDPSRCSVCGASRIIRIDGSFGRCGNVTDQGCPDPMHDVEAEKAAVISKTETTPPSSGEISIGDADALDPPRLGGVDRGKSVKLPRGPDIMGELLNDFPPPGDAISREQIKNGVDAMSTGYPRSERIIYVRDVLNIIESSPTLSPAPAPQTPVPMEGIK